MTQRLYIVLDAALDAGLKMAQAVHGGFGFQVTYPEIHHTWHTESNNIVVLQVDDLAELTEHLEAQDFALVQFTEPDLDGAITAICVEPCAGRYLSHLPLAFASVELEGIAQGAA